MLVFYSLRRLGVFLLCTTTQMGSQSITGYPQQYVAGTHTIPNSNLPGLRFFVYRICIIMRHSHLNDAEIPETKRFIPKDFELGITLSEGLFT